MQIIDTNNKSYQPVKEVKVIKKNGDLQDFRINKIIEAVGKSADRVMVDYTENKQKRLATAIMEIVNQICEDADEDTVLIPIAKMHNIVEKAADVMDPEVAKSYRDFRDYKITFVEMINNVYTKSNEMMFIGDRDNANCDSGMVSTQRAIEEGYMSKELFMRFHLTAEEREAVKIGYIYVHDMSARRNSANCCIFDVQGVMNGGFEMDNIWYNEPKSLDVAFDVIGDIVLSAASQQYGGFTVPEVDKLLAVYAEKTYQSVYAKHYAKNIMRGMSESMAAKAADEDAVEQVEEEMRQGYQGWEYKFNTVASSRGDYPFITITLGLAKDRWGKLAAKTILKVHRQGQGKKGQKKPVLFPKIVTLYTDELHGEGKELEDVFEEGILTSAKTMYPDWLSLDGPTHIAEAYHKYGKVISPMGCVEGKETIIYRPAEEKSIKSSIESLWEEMDKQYGNIGQNTPTDQNRIIDLRGKGIKIYDSKKGFVDLYFMNRNISTQWCQVILKSKNPDITRTIRVTSDHPFETENRGIIYAKDLNKDDVILIKVKDDYEYGFLPYNYTYATVDVVEQIETMPEYSYDVTTESEHFEVSGIYSHNCRAFLSPWYERGGMHPADEEDVPVFVGRSNIGVVTLNLPMILAKSRRDGKDFYEVLNHYLEMARRIHIRTMKYLGNMRASTNPLGFCEGGFYGGHLGLDDKIAPVLKSWTASFGFTALNELQQLYDGKSLAKTSREYLKKCESMQVEEIEGEMFALDVLRYIDAYLTRIKEEDHILYAMYGTPAEKLCGLQVEQYLKEFGPDDDVTSRNYVSNSFHMHVSEQITPIEKQDLERPFWKYPKGGRIQYVKYPIDYNIQAVKTLVRRAMSFGYYEGINLSLAYCNVCGHQELEMDTCPNCGSRDLTKIERMNGYLSYSRVHGKTRLNDAKMAEIDDRISM